MDGWMVELMEERKVDRIEGKNKTEVDGIKRVKEGMEGKKGGSRRNGEVEDK